MKKLVLSISMLITVISCDYSAVTSSVCANNPSDIQGIEGEFSATLMGEELLFKIVKDTTQGSYIVTMGDEEESQMKTCVINNISYAEILDSGKSNKVEFTIYTVEVFNNTKMSITDVSFDKEVLESNGIAYKIIENGIGGENLMVENYFSTNEELSKAFVPGNLSLLMTRK